MQVSAIDARIALTNKGIQSKVILRPDTRPAPKSGRQLEFLERQQLLKKMQAEYDAANTDPFDSAQFTHLSALRSDNGHQLRYVRTESAREARTRWEKDEFTDNSYHSSIVANPQHSAQVTAYDVALGQAIDPAIYDYVAYLCAVADWRTDWMAMKEKKAIYQAKLTYYDAETTPKSKVIPAAKVLIDQTAAYYKTGKLPSHVATCPFPPW